MTVPANAAAHQAVSAWLRLPDASDAATLDLGRAVAGMIADALELRGLGRVRWSLMPLGRNGEREVFVIVRGPVAVADLGIAFATVQQAIPVARPHTAMIVPYDGDDPGDAEHEL